MKSKKQKLYDIAHYNVGKAIGIAIYTGKVKSLYLAIGDINLLLNEFKIEEWTDPDENITTWDGYGKDYGDYNDPFNQLHYISDRFMAPFRLGWLKYGIENNLFHNLQEFFNKK